MRILLEKSVVPDTRSFNLPITLDTCALSSADGAIDDVSQLTVTLNNALEGRGTLDGTKTPNRVKRSGYRTAEIAGTMFFLNDNEFDHWRNQVTQPMVATVTGDAISSGYNGYMEFDLPEVKYSDVTVNVGGPGIVEASFTGKIQYHSDSACMLEVTMQNTCTQYLE